MPIIIPPPVTSAQVDAAQAAAQAYAIQRPNHTGEQAISTVTGLQAELDSKVSPATLTLIADASNVVTGEGLTAIPDNYKSGATTLKGLSIGSSVTSIGSYAFSYCSGFTGSLTIPNSVTTIGDLTFYYCSGFTGSLTIPNSVISIGSYAFYGCYGFTGSLTIGNSVTSIGSGAFRDCSGFTGSLTIPNSVTTIGDYAFYSCYGFTGSLTIGSSVTSIGENAFYNCSGFTGSLTIPNSVTSIGSGAFYGCTGLTNVDCYVTRTIMDAPSCLLGSGVTTIHTQAADVTWTAGADTIGGKAVTVIKDLV